MQTKMNILINVHIYFVNCCIRYECRCKAGSYFMNNATYKQHIKSKTHKDFIKNYKKYYKEADQASDTINDLKAD